MCRREMARQDDDISAKTTIIADYKTICSQLSQRIERTQAAHKEEIESIKKVSAVINKVTVKTALVVVRFSVSIFGLNTLDISDLHRQQRC